MTLTLSLALHGDYAQTVDFGFYRGIVSVSRYLGRYRIYVLIVVSCQHYLVSLFKSLCCFPAMCFSFQALCYSNLDFYLSDLLPDL